MWSDGQRQHRRSPASAPASSTAASGVCEYAVTCGQFHPSWKPSQRRDGPWHMCTDNAKGQVAKQFKFRKLSLLTDKIISTSQTETLLQARVTGISAVQCCAAVGPHPAPWGLAVCVTLTPALGGEQPKSKGLNTHGQPLVPRG